MKSILIIEDDQKLKIALTTYFQKKDYEVNSIEHIYDVKNTLINYKYDLIISDLNLPDGDGLTVPQIVKQLSLDIPIVFLTGRDDTQEIITGYETGAIDYVVKPIHPEILLKKIEIALKHGNNSQDCLLQYLDLTFNPEKKILMKLNKKIDLTPKELKLVELFFANRGKVLTKEIILAKVWDIDGDFVVENTVSVTINRLRKKLHAEEQTVYIKNIFGLGYVFGE